jgi:hypothetical protein
LAGATNFVSHDLGAVKKLAHGIFGLVLQSEEKSFTTKDTKYHEVPYWYGFRGTLCLSLWPEKFAYYSIGRIDFGFAVG